MTLAEFAIARTCAQLKARVQAGEVLGEKDRRLLHTTLTTVQQLHEREARDPRPVPAVPLVGGGETRLPELPKRRPRYGVLPSRAQLAQAEAQLKRHVGMDWDNRSYGVPAEADLIADAELECKVRGGRLDWELA